ncbi:very-long-chain 3-oxoacyl-CoA reductase-like [Heteronotia binoei]|uniref:very-long-chain 3-oxoacyl-CoA reductase-like n=1 Tax=Heteronotia binoei TaxID=13085 RepID=UPI00292D7971|nr:very-long-chain 3-oxoacyl-CoA reductase-like [Heteronotia binoei]
MASLSFFSPEQLLTGLGVLSVLWLCLKAAWSLAQGLRIYVLSHVWKGVDVASYGPWAVVTGATAGIGKAYAHELARRGLNVVLISRSLEKLEQVATEIEEQHGRSTKVIQADFTHGLEIYESIQASLQGLEIGILVNNVGHVISKPLCFLDVDNADKCIDDLVHCNMLSTAKMTQIVLPQMVARKKGIIINMSSVLGRRPFPMSIMYSGTKTFDDFFSRALDIEYRPKGIIVQSVLPLFVNTNMTSHYRKFLMSTSETFAHKALNTVGIASRTSGCLSHSFQYLLMNKLFPDWLHLTSLGTWLVHRISNLLMHK